MSGCCEEGRRGDDAESGRGRWRTVAKRGRPHSPGGQAQGCLLSASAGSGSGVPEDSELLQGTSAAAVPRLPDSEDRAHGRAGEAWGVARV